MNALLIAHLAGGLVAIRAGAVAIPPRKGSSRHALAGMSSFGSTTLRTE
jgi:hypothetical protein